MRNCITWRSSDIIVTANGKDLYVSMDPKENIWNLLNNDGIAFVSHEDCILVQGIDLLLGDKTEQER